jgi:hypothetical protein
MRRLNILLFFSLLTSASYAQFVNNGATVTIQAGATLRVETNFVNNAGGTITNNGTLEVQNDFTNAGTFNSGSTSTVKFIGTTNSNVTPGGATLRNVELAKTAQNVTLQGPLAINGNLTFTNDNNKVILGAHNLTINTGGGVVSSDANEYVVTNGTGQFVKGLDANGTITHEIGDLTNYTPVSSAVTGSTYTSATLGARVYTDVPSMQAKYNDATDYINREWLVVASGIANYDNTITGTYADGDIVGTESLIKGSSYHSPTPDWKFINSAGNATLNTVTARAINPSPFDVKLSGQNFFGKINVRAFLQGPYNAGTGLMTTTLNTNNLIPLMSPYADAPATVTSIPANVTDWVRLELRDPAAPSTATALKTSAFIKNDGTIVNIDGTSLPRVKNGFATSVVVLSHRNHLPIRTVNAGLNVVEPTLHDFSTGLAQAHTNPSNTVNDAMINLASGVFGLLRGNPNGNLSINSADLGIVTSQSNPIQSSVYNSSDLNLNGTVNSADLGIVTSASNPIKNAHN